MLMTSDDFLICCTDIQTGCMGRNGDEEPKSKLGAVNWLNREEYQQRGKLKLILPNSCSQGTLYNCYLLAYQM
jgi:hypothetical protein